MLRELGNVRQIEGDPRRRWFADDHFDLIVWFNEKDGIIGFQLCYDKFEEERALTWFEEIGYTHRKVDDGEQYPGAMLKATPILIPDGVFEHEEIARRFRQESGEIEDRVSRFVYEKLMQYQGGHGGTGKA